MKPHEKRMLEKIKARHASCASKPNYPSIPVDDEKMWNVIAAAHCIQVNRDRRWLLDFIDRHQEEKP